MTAIRNTLLVCPATWEACPDDLCRGSGCMGSKVNPGMPMVEICSRCRSPVEECECFDDYVPPDVCATCLEPLNEELECPQGCLEVSP